MPNKKQLTPRLNRNEPNLIIDGGMEIWPEGTSRTINASSDAYGAVLFKNHNGSNVTLTASRQSSVPSNTGLIYSSQLSKTAAGTLTAGTYTFKAYNIEGYDALRIFNQESTLIFFVKSSVVSNRSIAFQNTGLTHSYVQQYNISQANTWQLKAVKLPALNTCPGTVNRENGLAARLVFSVVHGSTYQTSTLGSWVSGLFSSGVGEDTTWLTGTNHDFSITGVMVLPGDWTSLQTNTSAYTFLRAGKNFQDEVAMSQRYFEKSDDLDVAPGSASSLNRFYTGILNSGGEGAHGPVEYKIQKRAVPNISYWNGTTPNQVFWRRPSADGSNTITFNNSNTHGFDPVNVTTGPAFAVSQVAFSWSADARF